MMDLQNVGAAFRPRQRRRLRQHRRLKVDALKWIASKLKPKKYGDRAEVEITGSIADALAAAQTRVATLLTAPTEPEPEETGTDAPAR